MYAYVAIICDFYLMLSLCTAMSSSSKMSRFEALDSNMPHDPELNDTHLTNLLYIIDAIHMICIK